MRTMTTPVKGQFDDIRRLIQAMSVRDIAVLDLEVCTRAETIGEVLARMDEADFDLLPIDEGGRRSEFVHRDSLRLADPNLTIAEGPRSPISVNDLVAISAPLRTTVKLLSERTSILVLDASTVVGIVTRGDLQRSAMRMYLTGLLYLLEANLVNAIQRQYPSEEWTALEGLPKAVAHAARTEFDKLKKKGEEPSHLAECLSLGGKMHIIRRTRAWFEPLGLVAGSLDLGFERPKDCLADLVNLRNNLGHAKDLTSGLDNRWADVFRLCDTLERMTEAVERL